MSVYDSVLFLITHVEPWWLVFFASLLLVISLTVFDSEFLLTISGGILLWTLLLFLRFPAEAALIGLPICLLISYFLQTRFYRSISATLRFLWCTAALPSGCTHSHCPAR